MRTTVPKGEKTVHFETRNMLQALHDRMRMYAAIKRITLEQAANEAVAAGLPIIEARVGVKLARVKGAEA